MKLLVLAIVLAGSALAQEAVYAVSYAASSATNVVTLQQPASPSRSLNFVADGLGVSVYCSEACTVTFEHSGTAATATAITPIGTSPGLGNSAINAYRSSNVGSGTVISTDALAAGEAKSFRLRTVLARTANANFTVRVTSVATSRITAIWREE
jgi:hypothetical protein